MYSNSDLQSLYIQAGGSPSLAPTMAAISLAESSGNPSAVGDQNLAPTLGPSYGLWQINVGSNANPQYNASLLTSNPLYNAQAAVALAENTPNGLSNWSTYNNGAYKSFLSNSSSASSTDANSWPTVGNTPPLTAFSSTLQAIFGEYAGFITSTNIDVMVKAGVLILFLILLSVIPLTAKFSVYVSGIILFLLLIQDPVGGTQGA